MSIFGISLAVAVACVLCAAVILLIICIITDYRPKPTESITELYSPTGNSPADNSPANNSPANSPTSDSTTSGNSPRTLPEDSLRILCWNIGYCGLGDNMDFFYDGGTKVRDTRQRTQDNLQSIIATVREQDADIVLLQEVDLSSKRSYRIDQARMLHEALPDYYVYFAYNYRSLFVPIPVKEPMGKVSSGLLILSKCRPDSVIRHQYPSRFPFPVSVFNLKRCLLTAHFTLCDGSTLIVGNTHNTAYDTGNMRTVENRFLASLIGEYENTGAHVIIGGDWNQYPAGYTPAPEESGNENFCTVPLQEELFAPYGRIEYARGAKTLRHLDRAYDSSSVLTVTDYFFLSHDLQCSEIKMLPLEFRNSDHNPVTISVLPPPKGKQVAKGTFKNLKKS